MSAINDGGPAMSFEDAYWAMPATEQAADQATILRNLVTAGEEALDRMDSAGITELCNEFVALRRAVLNAKTAMGDHP